MIVLIPAYKPDKSLVLLCKKLIERNRVASTDLEILVVDDGSGPNFSCYFSAAEMLSPRVHLLRLPQNGGKGAALRAGFAWCHEHLPDQCVITADADGQHLPADILAVGMLAELRASCQQPALVMGVRTVDDPCAPHDLKIPLRSRFGNAVTVGFFTLATGKKIIDTQTGLRGFTPDIVQWAVSIPGNRYEYEFSMLLRATRSEISIEQVPITRVYEPGNPTSHFKPVRDSLRIYAPLIGFLLASISGFIVDTVALLIYVGLGAPLLLGVVAARITSALVNFAMNRLMMHDGGSRPSTKTSLLRYSILALGLLSANAGLLELFTHLGISLVIAKVAVELALIPVSFAVQRRWVFLSQHQPVSQIQHRRSPYLVTAHEDKVTARV